MQRTEIIVGQRFGNWTVIDSTPIYTKGGQRNVKVQCDCGKIEYKHWSSLRLGKTTKCLSCSRKERRLPISVGDTFKNWTVVEETTDSKGYLRYRCRCSCGHEQLMRPSALNSSVRWFQCKHCATLKNIEKITTKVGDINLSMLNRIKSKALLRNIPFSLSLEYLWNLFLQQRGKCAITGDDLGSIKEASLDRIDSSLGYMEGNVQWVTKQANKCKHILSMQELYEFSQKVINHANQQPSQPLTKLEGSETNS